MKKLAALAVAFALLLCAVLPVCAASTETAQINQGSDPKKQEVTVSVDVQPTYTVTIPAKAEIAFNAITTNIGAITLSNVRLHPNAVVSVTVSTTDLVNSSDSSVKLPYSITAGSTTINSGTNGSVTLSKTIQSYDLNLGITQAAWDAADAGNYTGTLTFEITYVQQSSTN